MATNPLYRPLFYQGVSLGQRQEAVCRVAQMVTDFHLQVQQLVSLRSLPQVLQAMTTFLYIFLY